jgi:hypothetical protein
MRPLPPGVVAAADMGRRARSADPVTTAVKIIRVCDIRPREFMACPTRVFVMASLRIVGSPPSDLAQLMSDCRHGPPGVARDHTGTAPHTRGANPEILSGG